MTKYYNFKIFPELDEEEDEEEETEAADDGEIDPSKLAELKEQREFEVTTSLFPSLFC